MHLIYLHGLSKKGDKDKNGLLTSARDQNQFIRVLGEGLLTRLDEGVWDFCAKECYVYVFEWARVCMCSSERDQIP